MLAGIALVVLAFMAGYLVRAGRNEEELTEVNEPELTEFVPDPELPLARFSIPEMAKTAIEPGKITIEKVIADEDEYVSLLFSFLTSDEKKMSGVMNWPKNVDEKPKGTIMMLRGYVASTNYLPGTGTKNGAIYLAKNNFVTLAPDFLGYGESDATPPDDWQTRFEKPLQMKQLLANIQAGELVCNETNLAKKSTSKKKAELELEAAYADFCESLGEKNQVLTQNHEKIGLWAHSNGGQISLTLLEITEQMLPTTLWAPVSVGFPYSVLFFTDEYEDEGKGMRKYINLFEQDYDVFDFSHTTHLEKLPAGQIMQLHHGTADDAALIAWSDEFVQKIKNENREREKEAIIDLTYFRYAGADHNLRPDWDTVIARDVKFFEEAFGQESAKE